MTWRANICPALSRGGDEATQAGRGAAAGGTAEAAGDEGEWVRVGGGTRKEWVAAGGPELTTGDEGNSVGGGGVGVKAASKLGWDGDGGSDEVTRAVGAAGEWAEGGWVAVDDDGAAAAQRGRDTAVSRATLLQLATCACTGVTDPLMSGIDTMWVATLGTLELAALGPNTCIFSSAIAVIAAHGFGTAATRMVRQCRSTLG